MTEHIELVCEVGVDQVITSEVLMQVLLTVLPVGIRISRHSRPAMTHYVYHTFSHYTPITVSPDLLLYHQVHVAAGEGVASAKDAGDHHHQGAQAAVHNDLDRVGIQGIEAGLLMSVIEIRS